VEYKETLNNSFVKNTGFFVYNKSQDKTYLTYIL